MMTGNKIFSRTVIAKLLILSVLGMGVLQGCITVGPDYVPPEQTMPDAWHQELTKDLTEGEENLKTWWKSLNDPILNSLIERAAAGNLDLQEAAARVMEAQARRGISTGERFPDINGKGAAERSRTSEDFFPPTGSRNDNIYGLGLDASWEIDFWGRIRRLVESADAGLQASVEAYRDVQVLLFAEIALNYVEVRTLQARISFAESNVKTQRDSLEITEARLKAEITGELDVRQAELNLARTESTIPVLRASMKQAINRLGVLLGEFPSALYDELIAPIPIPSHRTVSWSVCRQISCGSGLTSVRQNVSLLPRLHVLGWQLQNSTPASSSWEISVLRGALTFSTIRREDGLSAHLFAGIFLTGGVFAVLSELKMPAPNRHWCATNRLCSMPWKRWKIP